MVDMACVVSSTSAMVCASPPFVYDTHVNEVEGVDEDEENGEEGEAEQRQQGVAPEGHQAVVGIQTNGRAGPVRLSMPYCQMSPEAEGRTGRTYPTKGLRSCSVWRLSM